MNPNPHNALVAVVGGSGTGKGWLIERLCALFGNQATHLELDHFYRDRSHLSIARRAQLNFDIPSAIDWEAAKSALLDSQAGRVTLLPSYDFATYSRRSEPAMWAPAPIVFVDGLWLLRSPEIRSLFTLKLYLDAPTSLRASRRLARDVAERGYRADDVAHRFHRAVVPMHERYVEPQKKFADLVLAQPFQEPQLRTLADRLWSLAETVDVAPAWNRQVFSADLMTALLNHEYSH
jgi:uridine kinase